MATLTIQFLGTSARFPLPRWGCDVPMPHTQVDPKESIPVIHPHQPAGIG